MAATMAWLQYEYCDRYACHVGIDSTEALQCTAEVLQRYCRGTAEVLQRYCRGTTEVLQRYCSDTAMAAQRAVSQPLSKVSRR